MKKETERLVTNRVAVASVKQPPERAVIVSPVRKFNLRDRVRKIGTQEVRTVEQIRDGAGTEPNYWIQLGSDFVTRIWAKESELEPAGK